MLQLRRLSFFVIASVAILTFGCSNYVITTNLRSTLNPNSSCAIGSIENSLPIDTELDKMPTVEEISKFKSCLANELIKGNVFIDIDDFANSSRYVVRGEIIEFNRGNGFLRFMFGVLANANAKLLANLELVDSFTGEVIFAGNFRGEVSDFMMPGEEMYKMVAKGLVKALNKENIRLLNGEPVKSQ
jgi:hypothetical protein